MVQEFVNTRSGLREVDLLEGSEGTARWLAGRGLLSDGSAEVSEVDRRRLISFREGLRGVLVTHNQGNEERGAATIFEELDDIVGSALLRVCFGSSGKPRLLPAEEEEGVEKAMALLLTAVLRAAGEGTWERLKACRNEACRWAFYDNSRNRSGTWCDMDTCGARHKMRAYRRRKKGD